MKRAMLLGMVLMMSGCATKFPTVGELPPRRELPDPLLMQSGRRVQSVADWSKRREELKALFTHYMYGKVPAETDYILVHSQIGNTNLFGGKATKREIAIDVGSPKVATIHLLLVTPNAKKPAPVFVCLNFNGNQAILRDPDVAITKHWLNSGTGVVDHRMTEAGRGAEADAWDVERTIDRGYALATFHTADIQEDRTNAVDGTREKFPDCDWGNIAAWAWGISRAIDALETFPEIDKNRIAAFGHSRNGKAALVAAAYDERIALCIPHQAGCGGTAPNRYEIGGQEAGKCETPKIINGHFPHWFNPEFKTFVDAPEKLPFDQHELMALVAPRALLISVAEEDKWSNPPGQFAMERAAEPAWRLLGAPKMELQTYPAAPVLSKGVMGFYYRTGKHATQADDWAAFLAYADAQFRK